MRKWLRRFCRFLFKKPVTWLANRYSSAPNITAVHRSLTRLLKAIDKGQVKKGLELRLPIPEARLVIMSDHHKGSGNEADDFRQAKPNYLEALTYYHKKDFIYIALGDVEELWENDMNEVYKENTDSFALEKNFVAANRFIKIVGNHDLFWIGSVLSTQSWLEKMYGLPIPVYEGLLVNLEGYNQPLRLFLTHGHQGDKQSDGNRFSKWFVSAIWSRLQAYLDININAPSKDYLLRDRHNIMMYEWTVKHPHTMLITGHTHKPVFASLNHLEKIQAEMETAKRQNLKEEITKLEAEYQKRLEEYQSNQAYQMKKPSYFNSGCCCFQDGDITAIEVEQGRIRLVKWHEESGKTKRDVLQEAGLEELAGEL
jgi:UDP-2,3-diacylglucosamine pyrophosphatase LpxH